jgi:divinyl protochlorophyllide a 8-vinyl-reductase
MAAALETEGGPALALRIFEEAGLAARLARPPSSMIPQEEAARLHGVVARRLPRETAARIAADAGRRTAAYIMANRIPLPARLVLRALPARIAAPLLLDAIARHAWTFAGSARVSTGRAPLALVLAANPLATPGCPWHQAVLEHLFETLAGRRLSVRHTACCATGAPACRFEIA